MANVVRVRVEFRKKHNDPRKNLKEMIIELRKRVGAAGILHDYKEHQYFESKSRKDRRKRRDSAKKQLMESIERRILAGETVKEPAGVVKKVMSNIKKEKEREKEKERQKEKYKERQQNYEEEYSSF